MVKTPNVRHSKPRRDPVTIDLDAERVTPIENADPGFEGPAEPASATDAPVSESPETADESFMQKPTEPDDAVAATATADMPDEEPASSATTPDDFGRNASASEAPPLLHATAPPKPAPVRAAGGVSAIAAGVIGAVIALLGAGALEYSGMLPSPAGGSDNVAVDALRGDLATLQTQFDELQAKTGAPPQGLADLQAKVDSLTTDLSAVQNAIETGGAGENAGLSALDAKIADVQAELSRLSAAGTGAPVDLAPVNEKIASLEAAVKAATDAAAATDPRLTALEESVASLTGKLDAQGEQPRIALSIAAAALKSAIMRGGTFTAELETLAAIKPDLPQLTALRTHAETGVATEDELLAEMGPAADAMVSAGQPVDQNAGFMDQLWSSAGSLVTVRPVGVVEGPGVPETVARMEAALKSGDLAKAMGEYETLPETAKAAGGAFAARVKARLDVTTLVEQAIAEAMKSA